MEEQNGRPTMRAPQTEGFEEAIYENAVILADGRLYREAAAEFGKIPDFRDAQEQKLFCEQKAKDADKDAIYADADKAASNANIRSQEKAIALFQRIPGWRDAEARITEAEKRIEELRIQEREERAESIRMAEEKRARTKKRKKIIIRAAIITVAVAAVCIAAGILFKKYAVPEIRYRQAVQLAEAGDDDAAYRAMHCMNYRDSSDYVFRYAKNRLTNVEVGSTVLFGSFPQSRVSPLEYDSLEWLVLEKDGSKCMLISKYALICLPYMDMSPDSSISVSWSSSYIRKWLNSDFISYAFDVGEQRFLLRTTVPTDDNPSYSSGNSMNTIDKVYLLSIPEALKYFPTNEERVCYATQFATKYGAYRSSVGGTCWWWLRTPGCPPGEFVADEAAAFTDSRASGVGTSGEIVEIGHDVYNYGYAVRPVIWIDLDTTETDLYHPIYTPEE